MVRARVLCVVGALGVQACGARPLPTGVADRDGGVISRTDLASPVDVVPRDTPAGADMSAPADAGSGADGGAPDSGAADVGCPSGGNGHTPQPAPLFGASMTLNLPSGMLADSVAIGDVTGDGRADVIVGTTGVLVFPQTASGLLGAPITYKVPPTETALIVDVGDVNGDGLLDVVYTRKSGVGILLGNSSGGLDPAILLDGTQGGGAGEQVVAVADLNGDGRADVVAAGWATAGVDVWFQDQAGALSPTTTFACPHGGSETMAVGDVDGDGLSDILISGLAQTDVCVLLQAPGGFAPGISIPAGVRFIAGLAVGRFGAPACGPDIAFTVSLNSPMSKLGLLGPPASPGAPAFLDSYDIPTSSVVADVDGDGRDDIVLVHDGWNAVGVYRGLRSGGVAAEERYPFSSMGSGGEAIAVGDINGDGRPDVVGVVVEDVVIAYHR